MRSLFFLSLIMTFFQVTSSAQVLNGSVLYNHSSNIDTEGMPPHIAESMPKSADNSMQLLFNKTQSLYQKDPNFQEEVDPNDNRPRFFKRMREMAVNTYFKDLESNKLLQQTNFFGKEFLVDDVINNFKWKVNAGEQKNILGYTCMKAYYQDSTHNLVAFFTPQIPVSQGPDIYGGLPGLILEVQSANFHIMAKEVKPGEVTIKQPTKGTKKSREEFEKIKAEKIKEQTEMRGGSGQQRRPMFFGH